MSNIQNISQPMSLALMQKLKSYKQLVKLNLSLLVVFGSVVGYLIVPGVAITASKIIWLFIGGMLITASANACNEVFEMDTDLIMKRTSTRPLPTGQMSILEALSFAFIALIIGCVIMYWQFNLLSTLLSVLSFAIYTMLYTPLKRISSICVFVGAIPGALPVLIGWVAGANSITYAGLTLFILQFLWQFPHFWAIAWIGNDEYKKAGLKMLPNANKESKFTALQCVLYTSALLAMSVLPKFTGISNWLAVIIIAIAGIWFLYNAILFYKSNTKEDARKLMFASFIYLPLVYIALLIDKI
jgi:heme o synthase